MNVSRETMVKLQRYEALLRKWNPAINLVAKSTLEDAWARHFEDSAQVYELCPEGSAHWVDLGSGGGFPGMVVVIMATEQRPQLKVTLVESDQRKATFLRTVARECAVDVAVQAVRSEDLPPQSADVVSARAFAPLHELLGHAARHLRPGGSAILLKGAQAEAEIAEALASWRFTLQKTPSKTDPRAVILTIGELRRAG